MIGPGRNFAKRDEVVILYNLGVLPSKNPFKRRIRRVIGNSLDLCLYFDYLIASTKKKSHIKNLNTALSDKKIRRLAVYAIYFVDECQREENLNNFKVLKKKFDQVLVINTGKLELGIPNEFMRRNIGRDLGSYSEVVKSISQSNCILSEVLFLNDSVHWINNGLDRAIEKARKINAHLCSLTISSQVSFHVQSYFMLCKSVNQDILRVLDVPPMKFKRSLVHYGERRISRILIKNGYTLRSVLKNQDLEELTLQSQLMAKIDCDTIKGLRRMKVELNPTIHFWPGLLLSGRCYKKSLLRNPSKFQINPAAFLGNRKSLKTFTI